MSILNLSKIKKKEGVNQEPEIDNKVKEHDYQDHTKDHQTEENLEKNKEQSLENKESSEKDLNTNEETIATQSLVNIDNQEIESLKESEKQVIVAEEDKQLSEKHEVSSKIENDISKENLNKNSIEHFDEKKAIKH